MSNDFATPAQPATPSMGALKTEYRGLYVWGRNDFAQIAGSEVETVTQPTLAPILQGKRVVHISGNLFHAAYVTGVSSPAC